MHEYGDITPQPPKKPKSGSLSSRTAKTAEKGGATKPPTQAEQMKNKFELALMGKSQDDPQKLLSSSQDSQKERLVARVVPQKQQKVSDGAINATTVNKLLQMEKDKDDKLVSPPSMIKTQPSDPASEPLYKHQAATKIQVWIHEFYQS